MGSQTQSVLSCGVSEKTFAPILSPTQRTFPIEPDDTSISICVQFLRRNWQVLPLTWPLFETWLPADAQKRRDVQALKGLKVAVQHAARLSNKLTLKLAAALSDAEIPYAMMKGSATRYSVFKEPILRAGYDIDIAVPKPYLNPARQLFAWHGFEPAEWNKELSRFQKPNLERRRLVEKNHYELGFLVNRQVVDGLPNKDAVEIKKHGLSVKGSFWHRTPSGDLATYTCLDVHHGISTEIPVDSIVSSAVTMTVKQQPVKVANSTWLVFHALFKLYWEGVHEYGKGLYQYADLCRLVPQLTDDQTSDLIYLLERYRLEAGAFYVFRRLPSVFGVALPQRLDAFVKFHSVPPTPRVKPKNVNDMGDMWAKLFYLR